MVTHPRVLDNTVRKTDDRRKRKRAEKAERRAAEESVQEQEVRRLKNLKGEEIQQRSGWIFLLTRGGRLDSLTLWLQVSFRAVYFVCKLLLINMDWSKRA